MTNYTIIRKSLNRARPYLRYVVGIFVLNLLASPIFLLKPLALKILIDSGFGSSDLPGFIRFFFPENFTFSFTDVVIISIALVLLVALIENLYSVIIWLLNTFTGEKLVRTFRQFLFDHMQQLSLSYHDEKGTADSVYRLQYDTAAVRTLIIGNLSPILTSAISLAVIVAIMFSIHWQFGLITCCLLPPMALLIRNSTVKLKKGWKEVKQSESSAMSVVQEVLTSMRLVKSFGQEQKESTRFMNKADIAMKGQFSVARTGAWFYFGVGMLYASGTALFFYVGSTYVRSGEITLGVLTMVLAYLAQLYTPLEKISRNLNEIQSSLTSLERVFKIIDEKTEVAKAIHPVPVARVDGHVRFKDVKFGYRHESAILKGISFTIEPGQTVGIMGSTGSGKSTLFNLLMRFYDPGSGQILVDGMDIKAYRLADYRKQFAMVLQDSLLFSTSIAENIAYGADAACHDDIVRAAILANAHQFISALPDGYDTVVGERGMTLSGGERQRIAIARAFMKDAPMLLLDEPTSALDTGTEAQIVDAIATLMQGRTTFMITHRLNTLKDCDVILHLEGGMLAKITHQHRGRAHLISPVERFR